MMLEGNIVLRESGGAFVLEKNSHKKGEKIIIIITVIIAIVVLEALER